MYLNLSGPQFRIDCVQPKVSLGYIWGYDLQDSQPAPVVFGSKSHRKFCCYVRRSMGLAAAHLSSSALGVISGRTFAYASFSGHSAQSRS
jgi:hypothetical protein